MQFDPKKTPHRVFATLRYVTENLVDKNVLMFGVRISYSGTSTKQYFFDEYSQWKLHEFLQFNESIVQHSISGQMGKSLQTYYVKVF